MPTPPDPFQSHPDYRVDDPEPYLRLDAQLCFALWAGARLMVRAYEPVLTALGLTYPQYLVMMVLWETDGQPVAALARRVRMPDAELGPHLDAMAGAGLLDVDRGPAAADVWLSQAGWALRERALLVPDAIRCRLQMPEQEIEQMKVNLEEMMATIERTDPSGATPSE